MWDDEGVKERDEHGSSASKLVSFIAECFDIVFSKSVFVTFSFVLLQTKYLFPQKTFSINIDFDLV